MLGLALLVIVPVVILFSVSMFAYYASKSKRDKRTTKEESSIKGDYTIISLFWDDDLENI